MKKALYVVLGLSGLADLVLGAWASAAWESFAAVWFADASGMSAVEPRLMGLVLGLCLLFFTGLQILALLWVRAEKEEGFRLAMAFGVYLLVSSIVTVAVFQRWEFLAVDGLRGALLVSLGYLAMNAPSVVRELRLPERRHQASSTSERHQQRDRVSSRRGPGGGRERGRPERGGRERGGRDRGARDRDRDRDRGRGRDDRGHRDRVREGGGDRERPRDFVRETPAQPVAQVPESRRPIAETRSSVGVPRMGRGPGEEPSLEMQADLGAQSIENRSRTPKELLNQEGLDKRSLAVVVRGDFKGQRPPSSDGDAEDGDRQSRRRRRRGRRGPESETGLPMASESRDREPGRGTDPFEGPEKVRDPGRSSRRERGGRGDRGGRGQRRPASEASRMGGSVDEQMELGEPLDRASDFQTSSNPPELAPLESPPMEDSEQLYGRVRKPAGSRRRPSGGPSIHVRKPVGGDFPSDWSGGIPPAPAGAHAHTSEPLTGLEPRIGPVSQDEIERFRPVVDEDRTGTDATERNGRDDQ